MSEVKYKSMSAETLDLPDASAFVLTFFYLDCYRLILIAIVIV